MTTTIMDFWKNNKKLWIPISQKDKIAADKIIYDKYFHTISNVEYFLKGQDIFSVIVYFDQFIRHFERHLVRTHGYKPINEDILKNIRSYLATTIRDEIDIITQNADEIDILFTMMLFKHIGAFDFIFKTLHYDWLKNRNIDGFQYLSRFYYDTYRKAYNFNKVYSAIEKVIYSDVYYRPDTVCDYYPPKYEDLDWNNNLDVSILGEGNRLINSLKELPINVIVSLSGGVDSMVLLALLKLTGKNPIGVHIIYGNRLVAEEEYQFISHYCSKLDVPLYIYRIEWIRRDAIDREFYESMTRDLRFMVYKAVGGENANVVLGHIRDDVVENIWTNLAKCQHLDNLKKMSVFDRQMDVNLWRPYLEIHKKEIYEASVALGIPFLKNTTPNWSNRGKFRDHFYTATHEQFGEGVDDRLILLADTLKKQADMLDILIYSPIFNSWNALEKSINIQKALDAGLDENGWQRIFEYICHNYLGIGKPSIHSIREFLNRMNNLSSKVGLEMKMPMKKGLNIHLLGNSLFIQ